MAQAVSDRDFEKAMSLRDPEFVESLDGFMTTSVLVNEPSLPEEKVSLECCYLSIILSNTP